MTFARVVEASVTNNCPFQDYTYPDDRTRRTTDTPGLTPFEKRLQILKWIMVTYFCEGSSILCIYVSSLLHDVKRLPWVCSLFVLSARGLGHVGRMEHMYQDVWGGGTDPRTQMR